MLEACATAGRVIGFVCADRASAIRTPVSAAIGQRALVVFLLQDEEACTGLDQTEELIDLLRRKPAEHRPTSACGGECGKEKLVEQVFVERDIVQCASIGDAFGRLICQTQECLKCLARLPPLKDPEAGDCVPGGSNVLAAGEFFEPCDGGIAESALFLVVCVVHRELRVRSVRSGAGS